MPPDADPPCPRGDRHVHKGAAHDEAYDLEESAPTLLHAFAGLAGETETDIDSILSRLVVAACELTGSDSGALGVVGPSGGLSRFVTHNLDPRLLEKARALPQHGGLHTVIRVRGSASGELFLSARGEGLPFTQRETLLVQGVANVAGIVIESAQSHELSERRRRWLEMFAHLTEMLLPPITLAEALRRIAESVRTASGSEAAFVVQVPETGDPVVSAVVGDIYDLSQEERTQFNDAVRTVVETGEMVDIPIRERIAVIVALRAHLTMPGVIITHHRHRDASEHFDERELLASFANHAALAIDRTQALEDREMMAVVTDRDRIARDLHDVVIQRLFATGLHMQSIRSAATTPELKERIDQSVRDLDQTIRDIRGTIFELQTRPQNSLRTEVRDLVREYIPVLGFAPSVQTHGPVDSSIELNLQQQLVAVLREALSNVARHADARSASVELQVTATHLRLKVSDDGKGVPDERDESGLRNARRRAILLGGSLDLWPNEPTGTSFIWSVPFRPGAGAARSQ